MWNKSELLWFPNCLTANCILLQVESALTILGGLPQACSLVIPSLSLLASVMLLVDYMRITCISPSVCIEPESFDLWSWPSTSDHVEAGGCSIVIEIHVKASCSNCFETGTYLREADFILASVMILALCACCIIQSWYKSFAYQLAFFTPGRFPSSAFIRNWYLPILKALKTPLETPPITHRLLICVGRV